nr:MAG TPA: hypothetical protein [Caudoviricetes sp.]
MCTESYGIYTMDLLNNQEEKHMNFKTELFVK